MKEYKYKIWQVGFEDYLAKSFHHSLEELIDANSAFEVPFPFVKATDGTYVNWTLITSFRLVAEEPK